jgi:hypothetical protein
LIDQNRWRGTARSGTVPAMPKPPPTGPLVTRGSLAQALLDALGPGGTGHHARLRPADHPHPRPRSAPRDRPHLARRPAQRPGSGGNSPLAELEKTGARVLLLGAGYDACTSFHLAERDRPVVRGKAGAADARLFPVAGAVAYAERRLGTRRPRDEFAHPCA